MLIASRPLFFWGRSSAPAAVNRLKSAVQLAALAKGGGMIRVTRETHEAPAEIQERVARAGGWNIYGEANFRVVWGGSRLCWIGGTVDGS